MIVDSIIAIPHFPPIVSRAYRMPSIMILSVLYCTKPKKNSLFVCAISENRDCTSAIACAVLLHLNVICLITSSLPCNCEFMTQLLLSVGACVSVYLMCPGDGSKAPLIDR